MTETKLDHAIDRLEEFRVLLQKSVKHGDEVLHLCDKILTSFFTRQTISPQDFVDLNTEGKEFRDLIEYIKKELEC